MLTRYHYRPETAAPGFPHKFERRRGGSGSVFIEYCKRRDAIIAWLDVSLGRGLATRMSWRRRAERGRLSPDIPWVLDACGNLHIREPGDARAFYEAWC